MTTQPPPHLKLPIRCPRCAGTGYATREDRHCETIQDQCRDCGATGWVEARPGTSREAAYDPLRAAL